MKRPAVRRAIPSLSIVFGARQSMILASLLCLLPIFGCASTAVPTEPLLTAEQRQLNVESFERVWSTIRDKHWDATLGGLDWPAVHDEFCPQTENAQTMSAARRVLSEMIDRLGQSHFGIIPAEVYRDLDNPNEAREERGETGMEVRVVEGAALVTAVRPGPAADAGVQPGWQIVSVNDQPLAPMIEKVTEAKQDSTTLEYYLAAAVLSKMSGKVGTGVSITFLDGDDQEVPLDVELAEPAGTPARFGFLPTLHVRFESRRREDDIGYIAFNIFLDPPKIMGAFEEAVTSFMDAEGIILDLRGNPGGIGAMAMGMAGWFLDNPNQHLGTMTLRQSQLKFVVNPRVQTYDGPLAILVDGLSMSTSEILVGGLKDLGRARVFGTPTAGAALPSNIERLPNGDGFQYAFANYVSAGGEVLEGNGVLPDVEARLSRDALLAGRDPAIEAAAEWIHTQTD